MHELRPTSTRWHPRAWPAPVLNGLSVGVGLLVLCGGVGAWAGSAAAATAASGGAAASVADTVCTVQRKPYQMVPAVCSCLLVTAAVMATHRWPWGLAAVSLLTLFLGIFWMSWGKRGGPQTFVGVLTLVFQSAAYLHPQGPVLPWPQHLGWVAAGAVAMAGWSGVSAWALARRYKRLALADVLDGVAGLMRLQARWTALAARATPFDAHLSPPHPQSDRHTASLLALIRAQAQLPETLQTARDLVYSQAAHSARQAHVRQAIEALAQAVRLRDVLIACQADLETALPGPASRAATLHLAHRLRAEAAHVQRCADGWRGRALAPHPATPEEPEPSEAAPNSAADAGLRDALLRRVQHLSWVVDAIDASSPHPRRDLADSATRIPSPLPPVDVLGQTALLQAMTTTPRWPRSPLATQCRWGAPVLRYATRTTLAGACALGLSHVLPWASHPHWILLTVAVVMRGSLEQTLLRRDARIVGTLVGCLVAATAIALAPSPLWLLPTLALAVSLAHGFVTLDYRVTAAAAAVLALVQGHLLAPSAAPPWLDVAERLVDTLVGAALAWAFTHLWPTWEQLTLPRLVGRLLESLARDASQALKAESPRAAASRPARHLARRDTQEALAQLTQALVRMDHEPERARRLAPAVEHLVIQCHRLHSQIAAVRNLLMIKHAQIAPEVAQPALTRTHRILIEAFRSTRPDTSDTLPASGVPHSLLDAPGAQAAGGGATVARSTPANVPKPTPADEAPTQDDLPATELDRLGGSDAATTTAWLLHRLQGVCALAEEVARAARPLRVWTDPRPSRGTS